MTNVTFLYNIKIFPFFGRLVTRVSVTGSVCEDGSLHPHNTDIGVRSGLNILTIRTQNTTTISTSLTF